jgi:hypothetical protein
MEALADVDFWRSFVGVVMCDASIQMSCRG